MAKSGIVLVAGKLIWLDGVVRQLQRLPDGRFQIVSLNKKRSSRDASIVQISEEEALLAWDLMYEPRGFWTKEQFFADIK